MGKGVGANHCFSICQNRTYLSYFMYFLIACGSAYACFRNSLLLSQTCVKSLTVTIRRHSQEVSFLKCSNNSENQISTKCFAPAQYGSNFRQIFVQFLSPSGKIPECYPARNCVSSSHIIPASPSVIVKCLLITSTVIQRHYVPTAIALQLCYRVCRYEGPRKPDGIETEWGTPTFGLYWWCKSIRS
jgi:hypothetical protein